MVVLLHVGQHLTPYSGREHSVHTQSGDDNKKEIKETEYLLVYTFFQEEKQLEKCVDSDALPAWQYMYLPTMVAESHEEKELSVSLYLFCGRDQVA